MKMKYLILLIIALFTFQNNLNAQNKILKVEYKETSIFIKGIVNNDKTTLFVSDDFFFSKTDFNFDTSNTEKIKNTVESSAVIPANENEYFSEIYIDLHKKNLTEYLVERKISKKKFAVEEKQPEMKWILLNDRKQIGNYNCKKAQTDFRGRTYDVWYTEEIPVSAGPWKFNGLSGLILSVKDKAGIYSWDATSIATIGKDAFDLSEYLNNKKHFTKISYKDFDEMVIDAQIERQKVRKARTHVSSSLEFSFSTSQDKEPSNEWRSQTYFEL